MTPWSGPVDAGRRSVDAGADHPRDGALPSSDASDAYLVMCRHYCDALAETGLYYCAVSSCSGPPPGSDLCFRDRCEPRFVQPSECFVQCDALDRQYRAYCDSPDANPRDAGLCPLRPDVHDADCRAACVLAADAAVPAGG